MEDLVKGQVKSYLRGLHLDNEKKLKENLSERLELLPNPDWVRGVLEIVAYQGFNPRMILSRMWESHQAFARKIEDGTSIEQHVTVHVKDSTTGQDVEIDYSNNASFMNDVCFLILTFINRGSAYDKLTRKSTEQLKVYIGWMKEKYHITTDKRRPGVILPPEAITFPRISGTFPTITGDLYNAGYGKLIVDIDSVLGVECKWPKVMSTSVMHTMSRIDDKIDAQMLIVSVVMDNLLHQTTPKTGLKDLLNYILVAQKADLVTPRFKAMKLAQWRVVDPDHMVVQNITRLNALCIEKIRELRPNDPNLEEVIAELQ